MTQKQKMRIVTWTLIILYLTLMVSADCASSPEVLLTEVYATEEKDRPFETPNDLRSHLNNLSHYYAVVGRPRFGKRNYEKDLATLRSLRSYILQKYKYRLSLLLNSNSPVFEPKFGSVYA